MYVQQKQISLQLFYQQQEFYTPQYHLQYMNLAKSNKLNSNTSIMASTLMQKIMLYNQKINNDNNQYNEGGGSFLSKLKNKDEFNTDHIEGVKNSMNTPTAKLNIQYEQYRPVNDRGSNLTHAIRNSKIKAIKQYTLPLIRNQVENNEQQSLKTHQINTQDRSQLNQGKLTTYPISKTQQHSSQTINNAKQQTIQKQKQKNQQKLKQQKSPKKVMMNFQLFFPKSKIKSGKNQYSLKTKRSLNISNIDAVSDIFRIKNSSKSVYLGEKTRQKQKQRIDSQYLAQQKELLIKQEQTSKQDHQQQQTLKLQTQKQQQTQQQLLKTIGRNSAQKYIQKIQKYKKYKMNQHNKHNKFGLNVLPAQYHEMKMINQTKKFNYRMFFKQNNSSHNSNNGLEGRQNYQSPESGKFKETSSSKMIFGQSQRNKLNENSSNLLFSQSRENDNQMNFNLSSTYTQGMSLSLHSQYNNKDNEQSIQVKKFSPLKKIKSKEYHERKANLESNQLLSKKNPVFGQSEIERKKSLFKNKYYDFGVLEKGSHKIKLFNMLNSLDQLLNAYCCRLASPSYQNPSENKNNSTKRFITVQKLAVDDPFIKIQKLKQTSKDSNEQQQKSATIQKKLPEQVSIQMNKFNISLIPTNKKQKYYYFVGGGNNRNLIRSIMKKRAWWVQTQNMQSANFVWTQLKIKDILDKEQKLSDRNIQEPDSWHFKKREQGDIVNHTGNSKNTKNRMGLQNQLLQSYEKQVYSKIFHKNMKPLFVNRLSQKNSQYKYLRQISTPEVVHNHYDANYMVGNKKALFFNLIQYANYMKTNAYDFIPMTFHVEKTDSKEFRSFLKSAKKFKNALWIVKPGQNSNRGNGIIVQNSAQKIKTYVQTNSGKHSFIIQKYLKNIFLYNRRKFDIRVYMLMVTIGGITKFFWYEQGYIRTSSQIYNPADISDIFIHLTNDAIQSKNQTYSKYEKGNKISYSEFQRYLDSNYPDEKYDVTKLADQMKKIATVVVKSTYFKLDKAKKANGFQLFGLDFLIDKHFKPWLLQVNTNPCLQLSSPVLQRLIPRMVENMFRITLDPLFRPNQNLSKHVSYFLYDNVFETNKFNLIFDSLFDSDFEWQQMCNKQKNITYQDDDEVFENNGEQLDIKV